MTPDLRFPEFQDPWRDATAGDAFAHSKAKGEAGLPIWSVTLDRGMVPRDSLDRHMGSDATDETNLRAQPGDLVYNMMRMWQGAVGQAFEECMVSPAYVVLSPKPGTCSRFFDYWFKAPHMLHRLKSFSHGLTKDRLRLYYADFAKIPIPLPCENEQRKIADFMDAVSERIALLYQERVALEDHKCGLMQRLFSRDLRFTREDGSEYPNWIEQPFGKIAERVVSPFDPKKEESNPPLVELENIEGVNGRLIGLSDLTDQISIKSKFQPGDILFGKLRPYLRKFAKPSFSGVCSSEIWVIRGINTSPDFLFYLVQSERFIQRAVVSSSGSKMPRADWQTLSDSVFEIPEKEEQDRITDALSAIDTKIDAVSDQITHMETFKKGLLQKLFV